MRLDNILNNDRVSTLQSSPNAYVNAKATMNNHTHSAQKVVFPEPYENALHYYNRNQFDRPPTPEPTPVSQQNNGFDFKSLMSMFNSSNMDMLKPLLSLFGANSGGKGLDIAKIFDMFKPKKKVVENKNKDEDQSSKFDDMIIIED